MASRRPRRWVLVLMGATGLAPSACGTSSGGLAEVEPVACAWSGAELEPTRLAGPAQIVGDVTGDGLDDWVVRGATPVLYAGPLPGTRWAEVPFAILATEVGAGDVDDDGRTDLVLARAEPSGVGVFLGPVAAGASLEIEDAAVVLPSPTAGGLGDLFGAEIAVADLTGDGVADLVLTAPSEREEGCSGVQDTVVLVGPLARGESVVAELPLRIAATVGECLGEDLEVADLDGDGALDLVLGDGLEIVWFDGPLSEGGRSPADADGRFSALMLTAAELTADDATELVVATGDDGALALAGDGEIYVPPAFAPLSFGSAARVDWPAPSAVVTVARGDEGAARDVWLVSSAAADPVVIGRFAGAAYATPISSGDLDGDGRVDLLVGDHAFLCP